MKKKYFLLLFFISIVANAQCPPAGVTLSSQTQVNNFRIQYPNCTIINGDIFITGTINNLNGLSNITGVSGALEIRGVPNLENLGGLENLATVGTDLILREANNLQNINSLNSLISVGGEFTIRSCSELINLNGAENLSRVGLGLILRDCESLASIEGLRGVTFVGEILEVVENPVLTSLSGLENIQTIVGGDEGALVIEGNDSLESLQGLGNTTTVISGSITISTNSELSYCAVPSICNYLQNPPAKAIIGIGLNVTGCNSELEVEVACVTLSSNNFKKAPLSHYPNPVRDLLSISNASEIASVAVFNFLGQEVLSRQIKSEQAILDFSALPNGVYTVKVIADGIKSIKVVKE